MRILCLVPLFLGIIALSGCGGREVTTGNDLPVRCLDEPDPGPCKSRVLRYFYDYRYDQCRPFHYGGCQGRVPFETLESCEEICLGDAD